MAEINMSSSYNLRVQQGFQALQLRTRSQKCSPIQQLQSASSSNMSPQVLFPNSQVHQKPSPQQYRTWRVGDFKKSNSQLLQSNRRRLLQGGLHQSFEINQNSYAFKHITASNLHQKSKQVQNKQNIAISPYNQQKNLFQANFTVSRRLQESSFNPFARRSPLKQFQSKMEDLRANMGRLKRVVDRIQNPQKRCKTLDTRQILELQSQYARILNCEVRKKSQSTQSGNRIANFQVKLARSEALESVTPNKASPSVSEFQLAQSVTKSDINEMSPIITLGQYSQLSQRRLNTNEMSSRMLMKKKFNWKSNRTINSV